ncbi:hypothetical protein QM012_007771 [Aureobasidium pullulans]|uniref:Knr4/Smi1-like domain-containing protein n=1 Tax=Aureobasidium pullulans TaxID=5580 RepID=A0ABR0TKX1_AURPU
MATEDLETTIPNIHDTSLDADDSTLQQRMHLAIHAYNQKSKESNIRLLRDCVDAISALNLPTEDQKVNRIAHVLFATEDWGQNEDFSTRPQSGPKQIGDYGWPPERLEQVLELPQVQRNCFKPAFSKEFSAILVEEMTSVVFEGREDEGVMPVELTAFFSCVSGVYSLDYDRRGLCEFEAPIEEGVSREDMRLFLESENTVSEDIEEEMPDVYEQLDVRGGFRFGWKTGLWGGEPVRQWHSFYLFCQRKCDGDDADINWGWRVVIHLESDCDEGIVHPVRIFDTIFEFLDWYGDWYNRLDLEGFLKDLVEDNEFGE